MRHCIFLLTSLIILSCAAKSGKREESRPQTDSSRMDSDTSKPVPPKAIGVPPATDAMIINKLLADGGLKEKWRVVTDADIKEGDKPQNYNEEVAKERKKDPGFPFIVKGDFNGDGKTDYGAIVTTGDTLEYHQLVTQLAVLPEGGKIVLINENCWPTTYLKKVPGATVISDPDNVKKIKLKYDAIEVNSHDSGGYYLLWNGRKFEVTFEEG